jgi:proteasome lid subunit RPN8/RPN11
MAKAYLMVDFQVLDLLTMQLDVLSEIKKYCISLSPYESGGLVLNNKQIIYCDSKYKDSHNFYPDDIFYLYLRRPENISFSFHSHPDSLDPSDNDIFFIKNYDIPLIIYSLKLNTFSSVNIKNEKTIITRFIEEAGLWKLDDKSW